MKASRKKPDFTLTSVKVTEFWGRWSKNGLGNDGGFCVAWESKSAGWGRLYFHRKGGKLHCDSEAMSRRFIKTVLLKMVDEMEVNPA